jgi:hypothetical protein
MDKPIGKAIDLAQRLRAVMLQVVALGKEKEEYENSEEYMQSIVSDFQESLNLKEEDATEEHTAILAQIDQLLYALMNLGGDEGWNDEADYEERTQLKLGEAIKDRMILARAIKI